MANMNAINEVSEVLAAALAQRPELLAKITAQKGAGKPVPGKRRMGKKEHKEEVRNLYYSFAEKHNVR